MLSRDRRDFPEPGSAGLAEPGPAGLAEPGRAGLAEPGTGGGGSACCSRRGTRSPCLAISADAELLLPGLVPPSSSLSLNSLSLVSLGICGPRGRLLLRCHESVC